MKKILFLSFLLFLFLLPASNIFALSLEDIELKEKKDKDNSDFGVGVIGLYETGASINKDRPSFYNMFWVAPQLKYKQTYKLQLNMGLYKYYLNRSVNPWDLTNWAIQFSDLAIYKEKYTDLLFAGDLRYHLPTSKNSRNNDSYGSFRALLRVSRAYWKMNFKTEFMGYWHFSKYNTSDTSRWWGEYNIASNPWITLGQKLEASYSPIEDLSLTATWTFYQVQDYYPEKAYQGTGSTFITENPRKNDLWDFNFDCYLDVNYHVYKWFYVSAGYAVYAPVLQNGGHNASYNPFDAKFGNMYLDVLFVY